MAVESNHKNLVATLASKLQAALADKPYFRGLELCSGTDEALAHIHWIRLDIADPEHYHLGEAGALHITPYRFGVDGESSHLHCVNGLIQLTVAENRDPYGPGATMSGEYIELSSQKYYPNLVKNSVREPRYADLKIAEVILDYKLYRLVEMIEQYLRRLAIDRRVALRTYGQSPAAGEVLVTRDESFSVDPTAGNLHNLGRDSHSAPVEIR